MMKAITIWQPYASLIVLGLKRFETRSWGTGYRGPMIIHAAKKWDEERERDYVRVVEALRTTTFSAHSMSDEQLRLFCMPLGETFGKALGVVNLISCNPKHDGGSDFENTVGHFGAGRYGWECDQPRIFFDPVPAQGYQGLWSPSPELREAAESLYPTVQS
jgi:hypothetical protein